MLKRNQMDKTSYHQKFFRPSCLEALNLRFDKWEFFAPFDDKTHDQIQLPPELTRTLEDTLLNYFSILREAENMGDRSCGTVGQARLPFPIAYNFLSKEYQNKVSYEEYFHSFVGIGVIVASIVISFSIEILQLVLKIGQFDIDDVILNTVGSIIGFFFLKMIKSVINLPKGSLFRKFTNLFS